MVNPTRLRFWYWFNGITMLTSKIESKFYYFINLYMHTRIYKKINCRYYDSIIITSILDITMLSVTPFKIFRNLIYICSISKEKNVGAIIPIIFWWCLQKYRRTRQIEAARSGSTNSTSRIDSVARMLFPLSFGLFNMAYWYSYFQAQKPFDWGDHMLKGQFH